MKYRIAAISLLIFGNIALSAFPSKAQTDNHPPENSASPLWMETTEIDLSLIHI